MPAVAGAQCAIIYKIDRPLNGTTRRQALGVPSPLQLSVFQQMADAPPKSISPRHIIIGGVGSERSSILLRGQLVRPKRTLESGYVFLYPELRPALADLVHVTI
jgi:uncharacterized protein